MKPTLGLPPRAGKTERRAQPPARRSADVSVSTDGVLMFARRKNPLGAALAGVTFIALLRAGWLQVVQGGDSRAETRGPGKALGPASKTLPRRIIDLRDA